MRVVNEASFSNVRQRPVGGVEEIVRTHIVLWSDPFSLPYSPACFGNVQMRGIGRQIEKEESPFLPDREQLPYLMIAVDGRIDKPSGYCLSKGSVS
jgi:hypothetical protein